MVAIAAAIAAAALTSLPAASSTSDQCRGVPATITGTGTIVGTDSADVIVGSAGPDRILGLGGDDIVCGSGGGDVLRGGHGADWLEGGAGPDRLVGGPGADTLVGGQGMDRLAGGPGPDLLRGGRGDDELLGHAGNDSLAGGFGSDDATGHAGVDRCRSAESIARCGGDLATRVFVLGDFGEGSTAQLAVAEAMRAHAKAIGRFDAVMTTGDNLYIDDTAAAWDVPYGWLPAGTAVWPSLGNHDIETPSRIIAFETVFGDVAPWYRRDLQGVAVLVLDSNRPEDPAQLAWLDAQLSDLGDRFVIAAFHHPVASCSSHGAEPNVVEHWLPRLAAAGVDLALTGHDHNYQRFDVDGMVAVVTGGGGRTGLYALKTCPEGDPPHLAAAVRHHFVTLTIDDDLVRIEAIAANGEVLDTFDIGR